MTTLIRSTLGEVVAEVARLCNDRVEKTTATAGGASTVTLGNLPVLASATLNDKYLNRFLYIFKGTSAGDERICSVYAGATRVATVATAWTATPTTTSEVLITEKRRPLLYEDAVKASVRRAAYLFNRPLTDTSLRVGNILRNGHFEFWDNSSNVATATFIHTLMGGSRGWSVQGTGAVGVRSGGPGDESNAANQDGYTLYGGKLTSDGTNAAYFEQIITDYQRYLGKTITFKGKVRTATASRVNFRILDGVNTFTTDTGGTAGTHTGDSSFQELSKAAFVISTAATKLTVECRISAGGAVLAYFDDVRLTPAENDYTVVVPPWFEHVGRVFYETGTAGIYYADPVPKDEYRVIMDSSGFLTLALDMNQSGTVFNFGNLGSGTGTVGLDSRIMLIGGGYRTDTMAVTTNIEFAPQLIADMAVMDILAGSDEGKEKRLYEAAKERVFGFLGREKFERLEAGHAV